MTTTLPADAKRRSLLEGILRGSDDQPVYWELLEPRPKVIIILVRIRHVQEAGLQTISKHSQGHCPKPVDFDGSKALTYGPLASRPSSE